MWKMSKICLEMLKYLTNDLNMCEMTQMYGARLYVFEKRHKYVVNVS